MRLILTLESTCRYAYDLRYHNKLQGFVYSLMRGTEYEGLHDSKGYKFFCFSNIYPPFDAEPGDSRYLVLSSPDDELIRVFAEALLERERINVGDMRFILKEMRVAKPRVGRRVELVTRTPVVLRIPRHRFAEYGIEREHPYVYWRPDISFDAFLRQLEDNLAKKFRSFTGAELDEGAVFPLFQRFVFKKQVCNHVLIREREVRVFGSLWEFHFSRLTGQQRELLSFGMDAGFGERNSLGFGFVEIKKMGGRATPPGSGRQAPSGS